MAEENKYDIRVETGADFVLPFTWYDDSGKPYNLTGASVTAQLRETSSSPYAHDFICSHNGAGGRITLKMLHEETALISFSSGVYDVFVQFPNGSTKRPLYGDADIEDNVTRDIVGSYLYMIGLGTFDELPGVGDASRLYYVYEARSIYQWNGTGYIKAINDSIEVVGEWDETAVYLALNIVSHNGSTYIAKQDVPAGTEVTNTDYWMRLTSDLEMGNITTVDYYDQASASIVRDGEKLKLNIALPRGRGITSVSKTGTGNLIDIYTQVYNDGTEFEYQVTNGNGIVGISLISVVDKVKTYRITFTNGTYFDYAVTDGPKGDTGEVTYVLFQIDAETGQLQMNVNPSYVGPTFQLNNGYLEVYS